MYTKRLNNSSDLSDMGNKCKNLALLAEYGFNVPKAYGITFNTFRQFIRPLITEIKIIIQKHNYKAASLKINELILNTPIPLDIIKEIEMIVKKFSPDTKFAVRSSGTVLKDGELIAEDSAKKSLAGQYESYLNVPPSEIICAIKLCWASLFNERTLHIYHAKTNHSFLESKMSVVVQKMILADASAVMMTQDPLDNKNTLAMETTYGPCEAIVSGKVTGDLISIDRNSMEVKNWNIGSKLNRVKYELFDKQNKGKYKLEPNSSSMQQKLAIDVKTSLRIAELGIEIEQKFNHPQDIELVLVDQEIFIVQTRNITTNFQNS